MNKWGGRDFPGRPVSFLWIIGHDYTIMLIDSVVITVRAGKGGDGAVAFNSVMMSLGPTGAAGGKGGDVYLVAVNDLGALRRFRTTKSFRAEDGLDGRSQFRDGRRGRDTELMVPRGTTAYDRTTGAWYELMAAGDRVCAARGGNGGRGNFSFRSSTNTSPKEFERGLPGEEHVLALELKYIADIGLIGLPNVGKSSFLNAMTNAKSPVADYAFTTLEPHLGVYYGLIIADLPGLIAGASEGKGLGVKFLRHIERTHTLFHFIDATTVDPLRDYTVIRDELGAYNKALLEKPEYIIISKIDMVSEARVNEIKNALVSFKKEIIAFSIHNGDCMNTIKKALNALCEK